MEVPTRTTEPPGLALVPARAREAPALAAAERVRWRRRRRLRPTTRQFCELVFLLGVGAVVRMWPSLRTDYVLLHPGTFTLLAAGVILAETLPVKIPRRGEDEEITLSTSFSMALLLAGGLGPALIAQAGASIIQDYVAAKPIWRIRFNLGQYTLSIIAALMVLKLGGETIHVGSSHPFHSAQLPIVLLSAAAFFVVNTGLVGIAVSLYQDVSPLRYFTRDIGFVISTAGVLLLLAPIVIATAAYSPWLIPLFAAPILAIHKALWQGARSEHAARHDSLTQLPNRVAFREAVESTLAEARGPFSVLLMDLDRFKEINDTLGHHYGDLLLQQVAQRLRERLPKDTLFARLGGDEFAILNKRPVRGEAVDIAHQVSGALRPPFELEEIVVDVQASIGIAVFPDDGTDVDTLLQRADVAMYRAKETRADVAVYDESYDQHSPRKLALSADLRQALQHRAIVPWFQPELDLATGDVIVLEALARWPHPQLGLLQPAAFLEMSEHTNLIKPLTELMLEKALVQVAEWESLSLDVAVAVNISPAMLMDPRFVELVLSSLANSGTSPARLKLEVTESALMADPLLSREILQELSRRGINISIDDFGTGYSSLAYLADLPVSEVKIDRSFVGKMTTGSKESIIVNSTIDLAHHLGLRAVAEGVENVELLQHLRRLGCDVAQGYAIGRPMSGGQATSWLSATQRLRDSLRRRKDAAA